MMRPRRALVLIALAAFAPLEGCSPGAQPPADTRTTLTLGYDPAFEGAAHAIEERYELDRPDIDVVLDPDADQDVRLQLNEPPQGLALIRRIAVVAPVDSSLRLIDLSRGTCDVIIGRRGTPLGDLGRRTLHDRGLDDQINPRLLETDEDDLIDWTLERDALGLTFLTQAAERAGEVRVVAEGAAERSWIIANSPEGRRFIQWLQSGVTTTAPLREHGFAIDDKRLTPEAD